MTDAHGLPNIAEVADWDQNDAVIRDIGRSVARHYLTLVESGVPEKRAYKLAKEMQWQWLQGVLPASPIVREIMLRDGEG